MSAVLLFSYCHPSKMFLLEKERRRTFGRLYMPAFLSWFMKIKNVCQEFLLHSYSVWNESILVEGTTKMENCRVWV